MSIPFKKLKSAAIITQNHKKSKKKFSTQIKNTNKENNLIHSPFYETKIIKF